jgi:uncharacterized protein YjaG (DUF416 family)
MMAEEKSAAPLSELSPKKQLAYALLIFERMVPRMVAFCKDTGVDYSCCSQAKDVAWSDMETGGKRPTLHRSLKRACMKNAPDTEDFTHEMTSDALNAFLTMAETMAFMLDGSLDHIAYISTLATDSVYLYVGDLEPALVTTQERLDWIASHPLMQQELQREREDIEFLAALPDHFDNAAISALKARLSSQPSIVPLTR